MTNAIDFFTTELAFRTDVADVHAALHDPAGPGFVLVDTRSAEAWQKGHITQAVHMPINEVAERAPVELDLSIDVVTYCWGPSCNGAMRGALEFATLGFRVREMIGGYEYWVREGNAVDTPGCDC